MKQWILNAISVSFKKICNPNMHIGIGLEQVNVLA